MLLSRATQSTAILFSSKIPRAYFVVSRTIWSNFESIPVVQSKNGDNGPKRLSDIYVRFAKANMH